MTGALDRHRQFPLMAHAVARNPAGHNAPPLGEKIPQQSGILEINRRLFQAKPAGPPSLKQPPASSPTFSSFYHCLLLTSRSALFFKFIAGIFRDGRFSTRSAGPPGVLPLRHEGDGLGYHFMLAALLAIFRFPAALLQPSFDNRPIALTQILSAVFGLFAEHDDVDETDFFL